MRVCAQCGHENAEGARFCNACAAPLVAEAHAGIRKTVTVVFCDLVGSTSLGDRRDPELLRELMAPYHAKVRAILERHGGRVEKFIGDAAMAVFGIPQVHEDDALRAVRAADEIHAAVGRLGLEVRIGVNTGEVVAGEGETLVTGDAVNVAARLEQTANPRQVLLGEETYALVRDAIEGEPIDPLVLKGKGERVPAYRLLRLLPHDPAFMRSFEKPFIGRAEELETLERRLARSIDERSPQLATIVGLPGIGKSRLAREVIRRTHARVLVGRCLSYGEGITYWPLSEIVSQLGDIHSVFSTDEDGKLAALGVAAAVGTSEATVSSEEIAWGFRKLFEKLAREQPLIIVLDDIHWAEPTLLDLIEYVSTFAQDAPLLLLCTARPELLELRPLWAAPKQNAMLVSLPPLRDVEIESLVDAVGHVHESTKVRIVEAAQGNPLFVEQIVAMHAESESVDLEVPPTIQALLSARIDRLAPEERMVLERASLEGRFFHRGSVAALLPEHVRSHAGGHLLTLVRKDFIQPDQARLPGDDGFRFAHVLIRKAAYDSISKKLRAELHVRLADWLGSRLGDESSDEVLGYHLEQAYRYRHELGALDEDASRIAVGASSRLRSAGERAFGRNDMPAAANLFQRALALPSSVAESERIDVRLLLASALLDIGRHEDAEAATQEAEKQAAAAGDRLGGLRASLFRGQIAIWTTDDYATLLPLAHEALPLFEQAGDERGLMEAWRVIAAASDRNAEAADAYGRAVVHARRLGSRVDERELLGWLEYHLLMGPKPVKEIIRWTGEHSLPLEELEPAVTAARAVLLAMDGRFAEARTLAARGQMRAQELGIRIWIAANAELACDIEMLAGDFVAAEQLACRGYELYQQADSRVGLGLCSGMLAQVLCAQERFNDAAQWTDVCEEKTGADGSVWRQARAKVLAHRGELDAAEQLASEAIALTEKTDAVQRQADAWLDLAHVLEVGGRHGEAAAATERAVQLYGRKGIVPMVERARILLASRERAATSV